MNKALHFFPLGIFLVFALLFFLCSFVFMLYENVAHHLADLESLGSFPSTIVLHYFLFEGTLILLYFFTSKEDRSQSVRLLFCDYSPNIQILFQFQKK